MIYHPSLITDHLSPFTRHPSLVTHHRFLTPYPITLNPLILSSPVTHHSLLSPGLELWTLNVEPRT